jgi:hypothetical protein
MFVHANVGLFRVSGVAQITQFSWFKGYARIDVRIVHKAWSVEVLPPANLLYESADDQASGNQRVRLRPSRAAEAGHTCTANLRTGSATGRQEGCQSMATNPGIPPSGSLAALAASRVLGHMACSQDEGQTVRSLIAPTPASLMRSCSTCL